MLELTLDKVLIVMEMSSGGESNFFNLSFKFSIKINICIYKNLGNNKVFKLFLSLSFI